MGIWKRLKGVKEEFNDDIEINKQAYRGMALEMATKMTNKLTGGKDTTQDFLKRHQEKMRKKGKKSKYFLLHKDEEY